MSQTTSLWRIVTTRGRCMNIYEPCELALVHAENLVSANTGGLFTAHEPNKRVGG